MKRPFTRIASVIFGVTAVIHLLRLIFRFTVNISGFLVPLWVNVIALMIALPLAVMLWEESE